jgi:hypothetical protein
VISASRRPTATVPMAAQVYRCSARPRAETTTSRRLPRRRVASRLRHWKR